MDEIHPHSPRKKEETKKQEEEKGEGRAVENTPDHGNTGRGGSWEREECVRACVCVRDGCLEGKHAHAGGDVCEGNSRSAEAKEGGRPGDRTQGQRQAECTSSKGCRRAGAGAPTSVSEVVFWGGEHFIGGTTPAAYTRLPERQ